MIFFVLVVLWLLLSMAVLGSPIKWYVKSALVLLLATFTFFVASALGSGTGWPRLSPPPADSQLVSCVVREPDPSQNDPGAIYLWLVPGSVSHGWFTYRSSTDEPIAYAEPYTRELHVACQQSKNTLKHGVQVDLRYTGHKHRGRQSQRGQYRAYVLPPISPPRKDSHA